LFSTSGVSVVAATAASWVAVETAAAFGGLCFKPDPTGLLIQKGLEPKITSDTKTNPLFRLTTGVTTTAGAGGDFAAADRGLILLLSMVIHSSCLAAQFT